MSLKPNTYKILFFLVLIFANNWIWTVQKTNSTIFVLLLTTTLLTFLSNIKPKTRPILLLSFFLLFVFQYQTTHRTKITTISPLEKDLRARRLNYYPQFKHLSLPWWIEGRPENQAIHHLKQNFFSVLDQNIYFFTYHPRENNSLDIYPKFSFLLLPFFLMGLFRLIKQKQYFPLYLALTVILLVTVIGNKNPLGTFALFPLITFSIYKGVLK